VSENATKSDGEIAAEELEHMGRGVIAEEEKS
jgi:hypothetical protein